MDWEFQFFHVPSILPNTAVSVIKDGLMGTGLMEALETHR